MSEHDEHEHEHGHGHGHEHDDELTPTARAALARWSPPGPPAGFAERVVAAGAADAGTPRPETGRRPRWPLLVAGGAVAAALAMFAWPASPLPDVAVATRSYATRETVALGGRGVAVVEPGAALGWQRNVGGLAVQQSSGDVFYRVDRAEGAPFVVNTPAGDVRVTGTCFRVEVRPMLPKSSLIGAAAGAAVATIAVVTVYEGKVLVASPSGKAEVQAGERVTLDDRPPMPAPDMPGQPGPQVAIAVPSEPSSTITREELLVRDKAQREQIAALSTRLKQLEDAVVAGGPVVKKRPVIGGEDGNWVDPTPEELADLAKECGVKIDLPAIFRGQPMQVSSETAEALGITPEELAQVNQVFVDLAASWHARVRALYIEATGDVQGADQLSSHGMGEELQDKAIPGEQQALQRKLSYERAGLLKPPTDLSKASPYERYFRSFAALGEEAERLIAARIGAEKAHALRTQNNGWPMKMGIAGCADESGAPTPDM